jgi:small multidrug resistance family-3 protein
METVRSMGLFILAGLCEIGGGYLVWRWLREDKSMWVGLIGVAVIMYAPRQA